MILLACALLAVGCAHDSDESQDRPHRHGGGGGGHRQKEVVTEIPDASPTPAP